MGMSRVDYNGETLIDISNDTVTPETLAEGSTAHNANGEQIVGRAVFGGNGGGESNILRVTAKAVFTSQTEGVLEELTHTFQQIQDAYNNGKTIIFNIDVGMFDADTAFVMPLCVIKQNSHINCTTILNLDGLTYIQFFIFFNDTGSFILKPV